MNNGFSNIAGATLNGLVDINADVILSSSIATSSIVLNGVDITTQLNQVPINQSNIASLQQITTGISYSDISSTDMTTINNNLTIVGTLTTSPMIATQTYVNTQISNLVASAPASLDTLNELALAMGNDANFSTTVINSIATKVSTNSTETISGVKTFNSVPICATNPTTSTQLANKAYVDSVILPLNNYVDLYSAQTISANKTFSANIIMSDGGTNSSSIHQVGQQLNITNAMFNRNITTITGLVLSSNTTKLIRTDSVIMPTINGNITGDNINVLVTNNLFISTVATGGIYMSSNYPTMSLDYVIVATTYPIGTMITSNIGTYFSVGTYVIANSPAGYVQFNQPLLAAIVKITVSTALITLNKGIIGGATLGNIFIDYTPTTNIQINTASTVTNNALSINATGTNIGLPTTYYYPPSGIYDLVNKTYADNILSSGSSTTATIGGVYIGTNTDMVGSQDEVRLRAGMWMDTMNGNFMRFFNNSASSAGFGFYTGSTTTQTLNMSSGVVYLQGSCLYGRNDGFAFNLSNPNGLYPIGFNFNWLTTGITFASGIAGILTSQSLGIGVWMINGGAVITRGTGAFTVASYTQIVATIGSGTGIINTLAMICPIPNGYSGAQVVAPMSPITLTCQTACTVNFTNLTFCTVSATTLRYNNFTFTKIA